MTTKCQRRAPHHWPNTHTPGDTEDQCARPGKYNRQITSGKTVRTCWVHAREVDQRAASRFLITPDSFYVWKEETP